MPRLHRQLAHKVIYSACTNTNKPRHGRFMRARGTVTPCCRWRSQGMQTVSKSLASCPGTRHHRKTASSCAGPREQTTARFAPRASTAADRVDRQCFASAKFSLAHSLFCPLDSPDCPCRRPTLATAVDFAFPLSLLLLLLAPLDGRCRQSLNVQMEAFCEICKSYPSVKRCRTSFLSGGKYRVLVT